MAERSSVSSFLGEIFGNAFTRSPDQASSGSFLKAWQGDDSIVRRMGNESTSALTKFGAELSSERERSAGDMSDLNAYFGDLDGIESELMSVGKLLSPGTDDPIRDRATLRASRSKGIRQRMQARSKLQSQRLGKVEESSSYIDPVTGETIQLDATSEDTSSVNTTASDAMYKQAGEFYDKAIADYYQKNAFDIEGAGGVVSDRTVAFEGEAKRQFEEAERDRARANPSYVKRAAPTEIAKTLTREEFEEDLAAGKTFYGRDSLRVGSFKSNEARAIEYAMGTKTIDKNLIEGVSFTDMMRGRSEGIFGRLTRQTEEEKMIVGQSRQSFQQLATSALQARMQSLGSELTLRQQAAQGELEARRKANANISDMEKKRIQQVSKITSSINDINSMFALQDSKFLAAENQQAENGVDFRSDRPQ